MSDKSLDDARPLALDALEDYVGRIAAAEGLDGVTFDVRAGSKHGDNYVGVVHKVTLRGRRRGDGEAITLQLIYKSQPDSANRREQFHSDSYFANEAVFYNEVLPAFERFQAEIHLPAATSFAAYPKCHHAGDALLLEDLTPRGFVMYDRQIPLDLAHCSLIMQELGRMHALSFALRDQRPEEFARLKGVITEALYLPASEQTLMKFWVNSAAKAEEKFLETSGVADKGQYAGALRRFVEDYYQTMVECVSGEEAEPYAVITHGDCWTNNILFKYGKDASVPDALCFLDFQIARYSSVVCDLVYVLFSCTDQPLRRAHYDALIETYHRSLARFLRELGSDPDTLFPFDALQSQLQRFGKFGLGMALLVVQFFTCNPEDVPDLDAACDDESVELADKLLMGGGECWPRLNGVVEDVVDRGYIA